MSRELRDKRGRVVAVEREGRWIALVGPWSAEERARARRRRRAQERWNERRAER